MHCAKWADYATIYATKSLQKEEAEAFYQQMWQNHHVGKQQEEFRISPIICR
jgi:hypothetical protein